MPAPTTVDLSAVVGEGTHAARPAFGHAGATYYETDTKKRFRDDGTAWVEQVPEVAPEDLASKIDVSTLMIPGDILAMGALGADLCFLTGATAFSDTHSNGQTAGQAIDGDDATYWYATDQPGKSILIDLLTPKDVIAFRVLGFDNYQNFIIESSDDNVTFTLRYNNVSAAGWPDLGIKPFSVVTKARYWRFTTTSGSGGYFGIKTLQLFPPGLPSRIPLGPATEYFGGGTSAPGWQAFGTLVHASPVGGGFVTPLMFDDSAITGGLYLWIGTDYVKVGLATT